MAVLPTPGSPISTGLFFVRRERTWITRRISWSRPMTGSSLPCRARSTRSMPYFSRAWNLPSGFWSVTRWLPRTACSALRISFSVDGVELEDVLGLRVDLRQGQQQMFGRDELVLHRVGLALGRFQHADQLAARLRRRSAADLRQPLQFAAHDAIKLPAVRADLFQERCDDAFVFVKQCRSRCSGSICALPRSAASDCALATASWPLIVSLSNRNAMTDFSGRELWLGLCYLLSPFGGSVS